MPAAHPVYPPSSTHAPTEAATNGAHAGIDQEIAQWIETHPFLSLSIFLSVFVFWCIIVERQKPLWYDELFTYNLATQPDWHTFWRGLPADGNPPLLSSLTRVLFRAFGPKVLLLRLPSLIGFTAAAAMLFSFLRRRIGSLSALVAVAVLCTSDALVFYAIEGRPYGLLLFFTMLGLTGWQMATDGSRRRRLGLLLVFLSIVGGILCHQIGLVSVGLPLLLGEAVRIYRRKKIDLALWGAGVAGLPLLAWTLPMGRRTSRALFVYRGPTPEKMHLHTIVREYLSFLSALQTSVLVPLCVLALLGVAVFLMRRRRADTWVPVPAHEIAALAGSFLTLYAVIEIVNYSTHYYAGIRYGIGAAVGYAALVALLLFRQNAGVNLAVILILAEPMVNTFHPHIIRAHAARPAVLDCVEAIPPGDVVLAAPLLYPAAWHYADARTRARMFVLTDRAYAVTKIYDVPEVALVVQQPVYPTNLADYHAFLRSHASFFVVSNGVKEQEYLLDHLEEDHARKVVVNVPACGAGFTVYQVTPPGR